MTTTIIALDSTTPIAVNAVAAVEAALRNEEFEGNCYISQSEALVHLAWEAGEGEEMTRGRVAVKVDWDNHFEVRQLAGPAPTTDVLEGIVGYLELWDLAHKLNNERLSSHAVEVRDGMSGCRDYLLRIDKDPAWGDCPIVARLHISMMGKLNEGVRMWLGDFIPLAIASDIGGLESKSADIRAVSIYRPTYRWVRGTQDPLISNPDEERGVIL